MSRVLTSRAIHASHTRRCHLPRSRVLIATLFLCLPFAGFAAPATMVVRGPAPEFHVRSLAGRDVRLTTLRHQGPVIVEFWGIRCDSCGAELTQLEAWRKRYGPSGLSIVAFSVDGPNNVNLVKPYVQRLHIAYPVVMDLRPGMQERYHASLMPTSYLVDRAGNIDMIRAGFVRGDTEFVARLEAQLPKAAGSGRWAPTRE